MWLSTAIQRNAMQLGKKNEKDLYTTAWSECTSRQEKQNAKDDLYCVTLCVGANGKSSGAQLSW